MTKTKNAPYRHNRERKLLISIGRRIQKDLYEKGKPIEWLSYEAETARSTIRAIFNAESNVGVLTLYRIARALGYKSLADFMKSL